MDVNIVAVLVAGVSSMILGALWYSPALFGKQWMALSGFDPGKKEEMKKAMMHGYAVNFIATLVTAYVLSHVITVFTGAGFAEAGVMGGLTGGFWMWLGFIATSTLGSVLWEGKPFKLWVLNNGYWLANFLIMGAILAAWV